MLIVFCLLIVRGLLALGAGLQVAHRSDLLLLGLLGKLVLSVLSRMSLDLLFSLLASRQITR